MNVKKGSIVGNWEVISERYKKGNTWFNDCKCICGTIRPVRNWHLNHSKTISCGCTNVKGRFKSKCIGDLSSSYYTSFKNSRQRRGWIFDEDVTMEFLWNLFLKQGHKCALSGVELKLNPRWSEQNKNRKTEIIQNASIDRIDNNIGYTRNNIQWVHKDVNYMKGPLSNDILIFFCREICKNNVDRKDINHDVFQKSVWFKRSREKANLKNKDN